MPATANQVNPVPARHFATAASGVLWLPVALVAILLPAWFSGGTSYNITYEIDIVGTLGSPWLPVAMGLLLVARARAVDLSVWGVASLSAVITWSLIQAGWSISAAALLAMLAGVAIGLLQAGVLRLLPFPSFLVTPVVGIAAMSGSRWLEAWANPQRLPWEQLGALGWSQTRNFLAAALFSAALAMVVLLIRRSAHGRSRELPLGFALACSGFLAAGGGVLLLLKYSQWHSQAHLIVDLRVLVAVVLAGGWAWRRPGGAMLAGILLPLAFLAATLWRQMVWDIGPSSWWGNDGSLFILLVMVVSIHAARRKKFQNPLLQTSVPSLTWAGLVVSALAVYFPGSKSDAGVYVQCMGALLWLSGIAMWMFWPDRPTVASQPSRK